MRDAPPLSVLDALGVSDEGRKLAGGQGSAFQYGNLVLKPCDNPASWTGLAPLLESLSPIGYRIARPVRFRDGKWVMDGWMVTEMLDGAPGLAGREREALAACDAIHRDIRRMYRSSVRPNWLLEDDSVFALADGIAWGEVSSADYMDDFSRRPIEELSTYTRPLGNPEPQITHGDPGGDNILFSDHAPPCIIDFSPYWRPSGYAIAMMLADGIAWEGSAPETLNLVADRIDIKQLLLRAVIFRLAVSILFSGTSRISGQIKAYTPVIQWVTSADGQ